MGRYKQIEWPHNHDRSEEISDHLKTSYFNFPEKEKNEQKRAEDIRSITVHSFHMSDVEDPDLWAAESLYEWGKSEVGQWVIKNSDDIPSWHRTLDPNVMGYRYVIRAKLSGSRLTEWFLKYHERNN